MTVYLHEAYGQVIGADVRLPNLPLCSSPLRPTIHLFNQAYPELQAAAKQRWVRSLDRAPSGLPWLMVQRFSKGGGFYLQFGDPMDFVIDGEGRQIWIAMASANEISRAAGYLYGVIFSLAFYLQGATCLHASAVAIDGQAVLFVGDAGSGKSSVAMSCVQLGFPLIADDLVVFYPGKKRLEIPPGIPAMRLRLDFANLVFGENHNLRLVESAEEKVSFNFEEKGSRFAKEAVELAAIFLLSRAETEGADSAFVRLKQREALQELLQFGYLPDLMDRQMRRAEFEMLALVASKIPVYHLPTGRDPGRLRGLCERVAKHTRKYRGD